MKPVVCFASSYLLLTLVSLRYIFGIPPLILVLLPVASPDCEIEGKNGEEYRHVLTVSFEILVCACFLFLTLELIGKI